MTTKKTGASISKHKTATTHKTVRKSPQAFDIIPRNQVRPQATARPVITASQPAVADNTLTAPSSAPTLQLKHKPVAIKPPKDSDLSKEAGVSVGELIAKRSEKAKATEVAEATALAAAEEMPAAETSTSNEKPADDEVKKVLEEPELEKAGLEEAVAAKSEPAAEDIGNADKEPSDKPPADDKPPIIEDDDSLEKALRSDDASAQPQEHSQALKDAIKDMGEGDERPHHELYGGKPVIVVHKDHSMSAVAWVLWFIVCVGLALLIVNFLIDADIIQTTYNVPHTDIL